MNNHQRETLKAHLDQQRKSLSDPFETVANRLQEQPSTRRRIWWSYPVLAGSSVAAALMIVGASLVLPLLTPPPSPAWAAIIEDLWVAEVSPDHASQESSFLDEESFGEWNLLDLSADQGI